MTTEEKIEVIKASDEGKEIEFYDETYGKWYKKCRDDFWYFNIYKYRVKSQPTRLDVANEFWEKTFGIENAYNEGSCITSSCRECVAYKDGVCKSEVWWNAPCEKH